MIKFFPLDFWVCHIESYERIKNVIYCLQISALVPEIFKFEKCVKYANIDPSPLSRHCNQVDKIVPTKAYVDRIQSLHGYAQ